MTPNVRKDVNVRQKYFKIRVQRPHTPNRVEVLVDIDIKNMNTNIDILYLNKIRKNIVRKLNRAIVVDTEITVFRRND